MKIGPQLLGGVLLSFIATSAGANIIFNAVPSGTGNNVQFNDQPPNQTGTTIFGNINDANNTLVQFNSTQVRRTPAVGQARIEYRSGRGIEQSHHNDPRIFLRPSSFQPRCYR